MRLNTNIRLKYSELLDRFVKLRIYSEAERERVFARARPTDGDAYRQLVIQTTVVGYHDEILPLLRTQLESGRLSPEAVQRELFDLAVAVNPALDIRKVTFALTEEEEHPPLYLLEGESTPASRPGDDVDLMSLEERLRERVIGQDEAVHAVATALRRAFAGLRDEQRPIGNFLFVGQTGVGKTELAKALSALLVGETSSPIRIDCSEYSQPHEYAKLIGAPPGYVGHDEGGILTEAVRARSRAIVLFDEIEKAHPKVHNLLLQIMDEGRLSDSKGVAVSFGDCLIILTSNVGATQVEALGRRPGFKTGESEIETARRRRETQKALEKTFKPEFLNRIDEVVLFNPLGPEAIRAILELHLDRVRRRLARFQIGLEFDESALDFLAERGTHPSYGARPLLRAIKTWVETPLADRLLAGAIEADQTVTVRRDPTRDEALDFVTF